MTRAELEEFRIAERLRDIYTPEGVVVWLNGRHKLLDNERPVDLIRRGEGDRVRTVLAQLVETAYA